MRKLALVGLSSAWLAVACWSQSSDAPRPQTEQPPQASQSQQPVSVDKADKQTQPESALHFTVVETVVAKTETSTGFGDFSCDAEGNIYFITESQGAIRKLNSQGETVTSFVPLADDDVRIAGVGAYALSVDGELYRWVGNQKDGYFYVLVSGKDGTYKRKIKLDLGFDWTPASLAVFANGSLLMTGQENRGLSKPSLPFTGIFRSDGRLLKEISLEDDEAIHKLATDRDPVLTSPRVPTSNRAVAWGRVLPAKDGNIYIMRWLSPAIFYVVSPGGEVLRRFSVDPGSPGLMPVTMHIVEDKIAILFRNEETREQQMKIVDLNGDEVATYDASSQDKNRPLGAAFVCYFPKSGRFTFLSTNAEHRILLRSVEPR